jgi:hypothetical protein
MKIGTYISICRDEASDKRYRNVDAEIEIGR